MQFTELKLPEHLNRAIHEQGYKTPTQIQQKTIPLILSGKDVIGQSQTGSGKTAAFGLPILSKITNQGLQALILTPTRELCTQVTDAFRGFSKYNRLNITSVYGGVSIGPQINAARNANIIVATPGRLLDLIQRGLKLNTVKFLVLDEADRMLDMGFIDDVEKIIRYTPRERQTILFSATLAPRLAKIVNKYMNDPIVVQAKMHVDTSLLTEKAFNVLQQDKFSLLVHCLKNETPGIAIVFCKTRRNCDKIAKNLRAQHINATPIHGGMPQNKRTNTINILHKKGHGILVATDVASRGLHIDNISHVYNYDLPQVSDDYVHRIGRTARAGAKGDAITFITPQDTKEFKIIMREVGKTVQTTQPPQFPRVAFIQTEEHGRSRGHGRPSRQGRQDGQRGKRPFWRRR